MLLLKSDTFDLTQNYWTGAKYAGVFGKGYRGEGCACGDVLVATIADQAECNYTCPGKDESSKVWNCGGQHKMNVFDIESKYMQTVWWFLLHLSIVLVIKV